MLETLPNRYRNRRYACEHVFPELTSLCPKTRLPDFYTVTIRYEPDERLVELKSLKQYFTTFRDREILHEEIANEILDSLIEAVSPRWITMELRVNVRGGIGTTVTRTWEKEKGDQMADPTLTRE